MARPIDDIADALAHAIIAALKDREGELTDIAKAGGGAAGGGMFGDVKSLTGIISDVLTSLPLIGQIAELPLEPIKIAEDAAGKAGEAFGIGYFLGQIGYSVMGPAVAPLQHAVADFLQTEIFDPQTAAQLVSQGILPRDEGASEAAGGNMDGTHFNQLVDSVDTRPDIGTLFEMYRRGVLSQPDMSTAFRRHGYPEFWLDKLQALIRNLLSPADLALAQLRGVLQPDEASQYAAQLGMIGPDFDVLIANTGEPPGTEALMEALRREFIGPDEFAHGIKQSRVRNEWLPTLLKLRYSPMSTSDAVRAVVENYLTHEQGASIAQQNGLEPEHWPYLVESWGRPLSHEQMLTLYHRGKATLDEVRQAFRESDLKDKYANKAIELGRRLIPERTIVSMLDHGIGTRDDALTRLLEQGFNEADANALIDLGVAQRKTTHKTLSRADIVASYEDGLIPRKEAVRRLEAIGYATDDVTAMLDLADFKAHQAGLRATQRGIEATLKAHHITPDEAITRLVKAGFDRAQAAQLVDQWTIVRTTATRNLTEAQIVKLVGAKLITPEDAFARLQGIGLSAGDARLWLKYEGIDV